MAILMRVLLQENVWQFLPASQKKSGHKASFHCTGISSNCVVQKDTYYHYYYYWKNNKKIEPKEIPSYLIPHLLVVFTQQLEILVTTL